ncbi:hypothetical protein LIER_08243 [Lithospermum erythrorhizon]|uniref:Uncharacterized protein n=1 Tax=Lithospermum erythrorhizon TaxID=34254 RepID=A0AAV3PD27_LITER
MRTNLVLVTAFVRYLLIDTLSAMEFYGFNEIFSPIFDKDHKIEIDRSISPFLDYVDDSFRARPFTVLNGCPKDCSFASFGDQLYICGGSTFDSHGETFWMSKVG